MKIILVRDPKQPKLYRICKDVAERTNAELEMRRDAEERARKREQSWADIMAWATAVKEDCTEKRDSARKSAARGLRRLAKRIAP